MVRAMTKPQNEISNPITAGLDDKSLASAGPLEAKAADQDADADAPATEVEPEPAAEVEVELVHHYTHEGKALVPGATVTLEARLAASLVAGSFAKYVR